MIFLYSIFEKDKIDFKGEWEKLYHAKSNITFDKTLIEQI